MEADSDLTTFLVGQPAPSAAGPASPWRLLPPAVSPTVQALNRAFAQQAAAAATQGMPAAPASASASPAVPGRLPRGSPARGWSPAAARLSRLKPLYPSTPAPAPPAAAAAISAQALPLPGWQPASLAFVPAVLDQELAAQLQAQAQQVLARAATDEQAQPAGGLPGVPPNAGAGNGSGRAHGRSKPAAPQYKRCADASEAAPEQPTAEATAAAAVTAAKEPGTQLRALELVAEAGAGGAVLQVGQSGVAGKVLSFGGHGLAVRLHVLLFMLLPPALFAGPPRHESSHFTQGLLHDWSSLPADARESGWREVAHATAAGEGAQLEGRLRAVLELAGVI